MAWSSLLTGEYPPPPPPLLVRLAGRVPLVNSLVLPCRENVDDESYKDREKVEITAGTVCTDISTYNGGDVAVYLFYCLIIGIIFEMMALES